MAKAKVVEKTVPEIIISNMWLISCLKQEMARGAFAKGIDYIAARKDKARLTHQDLVKHLEQGEIKILTLSGV